MARVPVTLEAGVRTFFCGPESFTPDLSPAVGEAPGIRGYFVAAGMNSVGVLSAGGLGRVLAHWIIDGRPDVDVTGFDVDRFRADQLEPAYRAARTTEILGTVYAAHTPGKQLRTAREPTALARARPARRQGGYLREVSGWEGADWFAGPGITPEAEPTWGEAPWFEQWEAEHRAIREGVGLMDMSFMAKFRVTGADAGRCSTSCRPARSTATRRDHLHPVAQRRRPDRGRPDRHQARRRRLLRGRLRHRPRARRWRGCGGTRRRGRRRSTTSPRTTPSSTCRARGRATCSPR